MRMRRWLCCSCQVEENYQSLVLGQVRKLEQEPQEKDDKMREARNEKVENEESGPDKNVDSQIEPMKASDVEKQGQAGESPSDQNEKDEHESSEGLSREELGRLVESRWTGKKSGEQDLKNSSGFSSSEAVAKRITCTVICTSLNLFLMISLDIATPSGKSWLDKIQETAQNFLQSINLFSIPVANLGKRKAKFYKYWSNVI
ncbi:glucosidase 2 subunit beta-like isoform X2 [Gossypium raimondii]|uniref:glucosidase 2 subunit beta-like isoform X2 n=1 Tax=Gossypium raimondii TaxID=29730 RepID=UPI00227AED7B|nr:glucosidase 2 subunit beta-like isoform X2 [Gossypium raimondii]